MALGILSDEELEKELNKTPKAEIKNMPEKGRGNKEETSESARKLIADLALNGESPELIANEFGISRSSISAYKVGANSTASYNEPNVELNKHTNQVREKIIKRARRKLNLAFDHLTEEKLSECKARDLSGIAKDMSSVIRNMEPVDKKSGDINNQFIFMVPPMVKEEKYPIIDVSD